MSWPESWKESSKTTMEARDGSVCVRDEAGDRCSCLQSIIFLIIARRSGSETSEREHEHEHGHERSRMASVQALNPAGADTTELHELEDG
jgi:hypothetical protein